MFGNCDHRFCPRVTRLASESRGGAEEVVEVELPVGFHHATLTPDGRTMYLHGPLDKGRTGLFRSTQASGKWGEPEELKERLGEVVVLDLRSTGEVEWDGMKLPGALWIDRKELEQRHNEIPRDRDVVLYCT